MFISPDSIIPDPSDYFSYNRYLYARGNPVSNNDPSGHITCGLVAPCYDPGLDWAGGLRKLADNAAGLAMAGGIAIANSPVADKLPAIVDHWYYNANNAAQNAPNLSPGGGNTAGPGGLDPTDPFKGFSRLIQDQASAQLQRDLQHGNPGQVVGAQRVFDVSQRIGFDNVQQFGLKIRTGNTNTDVDILDAAGNVHEVGAHNASQLGSKFAALQSWISQSSNPNATIYYWHFEDGRNPLTPETMRLIERYGVELQTIPGIGQ